MPVQPLNPDAKKELVRTALDGLVSSAVPFAGGGIVALGRLFSPSDLDRELARWRDDVTATLNALEQAVELLAPRIRLSDTAVQIGVWISRESLGGRTDPVEVDSVLKAFTSATKDEVVNAGGELEYAGLGRVVQRFNSNGYIRPKVELYETFDPLVHGWYPTVDAGQLARYVVAQSPNQSVSMHQAMEHFGWGVRRFNPAVTIVAGMVDEGRSGANDPDLVCRHLTPNPAERAGLRLFAEDVLNPD